MYISGTGNLFEAVSFHEIKEEATLISDCVAFLFHGLPFN